jgi:GNAT superfamily N-acetyltransferase
MALLRDLLGLGRAAQPEAWGRLHARPVNAADEPFLRCLYAASRADQMRETGWPPSRCRAYLDEQFDFQQRHVGARHPEAQFLLLILEGLPIGRLTWHAQADRAHLIELCLAPAWRRRGVGTRVLGWLTEAADRQGQVIGLHIDRDNPAGLLARRFGFRPVEPADDAQAVTMTRQPQPHPPAPRPPTSPASPPASGPWPAAGPAAPA